MLDMALGFHHRDSCRVAQKFKIPDVIAAEGPLLPEIAAKVGSDAKYIERIMCTRVPIGTSPKPGVRATTSNDALGGASRRPPEQHARHGRSQAEARRGASWSSSRGHERPDRVGHGIPKISVRQGGASGTTTRRSPSRRTSWPRHDASTAAGPKPWSTTARSSASRASWTSAERPTRSPRRGAIDLGGRAGRLRANVGGGPRQARPGHVLCRPLSPKDDGEHGEDWPTKDALGKTCRRWARPK